ncbi:MAG: hypothetical protein ABIZ72_08535 [Candidatus Limnocylindrales bacterium]
MTDRRSDQGFSVAPRRIGGDAPGPGRARRFAIAAVVVAGVAIIAVAWLGPRLDNRPSFDLSFFATPTPRATPISSPSATGARDASPIVPIGPTALPEITRTDGAAPTGRVALAADGLRILDLASGRLEKGADFLFGSDAVVRAPDDRGWTCVCFVDDLVAGVRVVRVSAIAPTGATPASFDVLTLQANLSDELAQPDPTTDIDIRPDGRAGLLTIGSRVDDHWRITVAAIDLDRRVAGAIVELGDATSADPKPSPGASPSSPPSSAPTPGFPSHFIDGPHVRVSPDGQVAFVWATVWTNSQDAVVATNVHAWRLALGADGAVGEVRPVDTFDRLPGFCGNVAFAAGDRLAWFCPRISTDPSSGVGGSWTLGTIDLDGRAAGSREVATQPDGSFGEPLVDRTNGWIYAWDPSNLILTRLDVHSLVAESVRFDPAAERATGLAAAGGTDRPEWRDTDSAIQLLSYGQIAGSPDGARIYVLGFDRIVGPEALGQASLGIFVVDRTTLALVDRWAPAAAYLAISVDRDGQVLATGQPGVDAGGRPAPWQGSLTVHAPTDGRILVRFGRVGQGQPPLVFDR